MRRKGILISVLIFLYTLNCISQIDAPVHKEIRTYSVDGIPSVAVYSEHYDLRPLTFPLDENEEIYSFIWESDSTLIIKCSKQHLRIWGVDMPSGLITMHEVMYGEDKYPKTSEQ